MKKICLGFFKYITNSSFFLFYPNFSTVKVCDEYDGRRSQWQQTKMEKAIICYINGVRSIEKALATFGKDGRFQSWCCLACKYVLDFCFLIIIK
jgi:hypothetical protein